MTNKLALNSVTSKKGSALSQRGFTLIELLIVIVIIGILAAIVIVILNPAKQRDRARDAGVLSSMNKMIAEVQTAANSDVTGAGNFSTYDDLTGDYTGGPGCGNGTLQNVITCSRVGANQGSFLIRGVTVGTITGSPAESVFKFLSNNTANPKTFCISAPLNIRAGASTYLKVDYPTNSTPTLSTTACY